MKNSELNTEERHSHQIQHTSVPFHSVVDDKVSKGIIIRFKNGAHDIKLFEHFVEVLKQIST